jgi:hypothetical protein
MTTTIGKQLVISQYTDRTYVDNSNGVGSGLTAQWANVGGDWIDSAGVSQGSAAFGVTTIFAAPVAPDVVSFEVPLNVALIEKLRTNNTGIYLYTPSFPNGGFAVGNSNTNRIRLVITDVLSNTQILLPIAQCALGPEQVNQSDIVQYGPIAVKFDMSQIVGMVISAKIAGTLVIATHTPTTLAAQLLNPPYPVYDPVLQTPSDIIPGIRGEITNETDLETHADVYHVYDMKDLATLNSEWTGIPTNFAPSPNTPNTRSPYAFTTWPDYSNVHAVQIDNITYGGTGTQANVETVTSWKSRLPNFNALGEIYLAYSVLVGDLSGAILPVRLPGIESKNAGGSHSFNSQLQHSLPSPVNPGIVRIWPHFIENGAPVAATYSDTYLPIGKVVTIEQYIKRETSTGSPDGVITIRVNGRPTFNFTGLNLSNLDVNGLINDIFFEIFQGGSGNSTSPLKYQIAQIVAAKRWVGPLRRKFQAPAATKGIHQHFFNSATTPIQINVGDTLFTYVYLDPDDTPTEVMLQFNDGTWEHRAYWGANLIPWGNDGTVSRHFVGPLPAVGKWVRLEVAASAVGLEGRLLNGIAYTLNDGIATWDYSGKSTPSIGSHTYVARATSQGGTTTSTPVVVNITNQLSPPIVSITSPPTNSSFSNRDTINFVVAATDPNKSTPLTKVELLRDSNVISTMLAPPFVFSDTGATVGLHNYSVRATSSIGTTTQNVSITIFQATSGDPLWRTGLPINQLYQFPLGQWPTGLPTTQEFSSGCENNGILWFVDMGGGTAGDGHNTVIKFDALSDAPTFSTVFQGSSAANIPGGYDSSAAAAAQMNTKAAPFYFDGRPTTTRSYYSTWYDSTRNKIFVEPVETRGNPPVSWPYPFSFDIPTNNFDIQGLWMNGAIPATLSQYMANQATWLWNTGYPLPHAPELLALPPPPPPTITPSPNGTHATSITDSLGNVWTLGGPVAGGQLTLRNGVSAAGGGGIQYLYYNNDVYLKNNVGAWFKWTGITWSSIGSQDPSDVSAPPPPPQPPPTGVILPNRVYGFLDIGSASCTHAAGWAADLDNGNNTSFLVDIYWGPNKVATTTLNRDSPDVLAAGFGNGHNRFDVTFPTIGDGSHAMTAHVTTTTGITLLQQTSVVTCGTGINPPVTNETADGFHGSRIIDSNGDVWTLGDAGNGGNQTLLNDAWVGGGYCTGYIYFNKIVFITSGGQYWRWNLNAGNSYFQFIGFTDPTTIPLVPPAHGSPESPDLTRGAVIVDSVGQVWTMSRDGDFIVLRDGIQIVNSAQVFQYLYYKKQIFRYGPGYNGTAWYVWYDRTPTLGDWVWINGNDPVIEYTYFPYIPFYSAANPIIPPLNETPNRTRGVTTVIDYAGDTWTLSGGVVRLNGVAKTDSNVIELGYLNHTVVIKLNNNTYLEWDLEAYGGIFDGNFGIMDPFKVDDGTWDYGPVDLGLRGTLTENQLSTDSRVVLYGPTDFISTTQTVWGFFSYQTSFDGKHSWVHWPEYGNREVFRVAGDISLGPNMIRLLKGYTGGGRSNVWMNQMILLEPDIKDNMHEGGIKLSEIGHFGPGSTAGTTLSIRLWIRKIYRCLPNFQQLAIYAYDRQLQLSGAEFAEVIFANGFLKHGQKHSMSLYIQNNTFKPDGTPNADGIYRIRLDGHLVMDITNRIIIGVPTDTNCWDGTNLECYHGGLGCPFGPIHIQMGPLVVATQDPGPLQPS